MTPQEFLLFVASFSAGHALGNSEAAGRLALQLLGKILLNADLGYQMKDGKLKPTVRIDSVVSLTDLAPLAQIITTESHQ